MRDSVCRTRGTVPESSTGDRTEMKHCQPASAKRGGHLRGQEGNTVQAQRQARTAPAPAPFGPLRSEATGQGLDPLASLSPAAPTQGQRCDADRGRTPTQASGGAVRPSCRHQAATPSRSPVEGSAEAHSEGLRPAGSQGGRTLPHGARRTPTAHSAQSASLLSQEVSTPRGTDCFCGLPTTCVGTEATLMTVRARAHVRARWTQRASL